MTLPTGHRAIALLLLVCGLGACASSPPPRPATPTPLTPLDTLEGETFSLESTSGKVVVLDFMSAWCEPCVEAIPEQRALYEQHADEGLLVVMLSQDDVLDDMRGLLESNPVPFPVVMDSESTWFDAFSLRFVPSLVVLDRRGRVAGVFSGYEPEEHPRVVALVEALLEEAP